MVRLGAARLSVDRDQMVVREQGEKGRKWLLMSKHGAIFPAVQQPDWFSQTLDMLLSDASK